MIKILTSMMIALAAISLPAQMNENTKENLTATGSFEVELAPQVDDEPSAGRMTIDKTYQGDLVGRGQGQMLSYRSPVKGSAGYVALEHFEGTLAGWKGSFVLQHVGSMNRGAPSLSVTIVPDSGTGDLQGISGSMTIDQSQGGHAYTLSYRFETEK